MNTSSRSSREIDSKGRYRAPAVRRAWIEKEDGRRRPIGIPILEDKIVQRAIAMLLEAVTSRSSRTSPTGIVRVGVHTRHWRTYGRSVWILAPTGL